ncbi:bacillithiol biosynthesis protein BshC [Algoriphagus boritolerans]|uniref:bacillithiol biosynthesis protein BshC n=1 Tax=Algoriphagus boritolerans TaxID=308111 RepID=UPI000A4BB0D8
MKSVDFAPDVFKTAYQSSKTLSEAVRKYVHDLFGDQGLVVVDGHDAALKSIFKPVITADLFEHIPFEQAQKVTQELEDLGFKSQIFPREINFFLFGKGPSGAN